MQSGYPQNGISTPKIPYVITWSDFSKLYPVYQKMALALMQTGKVIIVEDIEPALQGLPAAERESSSQEPTGSPFGGWGASPRYAGGAWGAAAPLHRRGVAAAIPPSNGLQAVALGPYYTK